MAVGLEEPARDAIGIVSASRGREAAEDVSGPYVVLLGVEDGPRLQEQPEVRRQRRVQRVALLLTAERIAEVVVEEAQEHINVAGRRLDVLGVVTRGLVVAILCKLAAMVVQGAIGGLELGNAAGQVDAGVVGHNGMEGVCEVLRVDDHGRGADVDNGGGVVRVVLALYRRHGHRPGAGASRGYVARRSRQARTSCSTMRIGLGEDLNDGLIVIVRAVDILGHVALVVRLVTYAA